MLSCLLWTGKLSGNCFPVAITIAVLGAIESLLSATVADGVIGDRHDSNTELIAQGAANIVAPLFGGIPATRSHRPHHDEYQQRWQDADSRNYPCNRTASDSAFPDAVGTIYPDGMSCRGASCVSYNMSGWRVFKALLKNPKSDVTVLLVLSSLRLSSI